MPDFHATHPNGQWVKIKTLALKEPQCGTLQINLSPLKSISFDPEASDTIRVGTGVRCVSAVGFLH